MSVEGPGVIGSGQRRIVARTMPGGRVEAAELERGPNGLVLCRWCDLEVLARRRRTFCSDYCVDQWRLRTDPEYVRDRVFARDRGVCAGCGADTVAIFTALKRARGAARAAGLKFYGLKGIAARKTLWDADHIVPVAEGGGQCDLNNLRTLCVVCHREETAALRVRLAGAKGNTRMDLLNGAIACGGRASLKASCQEVRECGMPGLPIRSLADVPLTERWSSVTDEKPT